MAFAFGRNLKFGLNIESVYNTYVAPAANDGIAILEGSFIPNRDWMEEMSANAVPEKKTIDVVPGIQNWTAKIKCKLPKEGFGQLLKNVYGTAAETAVGAPFSGFRYINSALSTTPTSISLLFSDDIQGVNLSGGAVKSLKLMGEIGKPIYADVEFIGGTWNRVATGVGSMTVPTTATAVNPYWHFNDIATIDVVGVVYTPTSWELTIENAYADGAAESYEIQTTTALANARKQLERAGDVPIKYTLVIKRLLQDVGQFSAFQAGAFGISDVELKQTSSSSAVSVGTNEYYLKINMVNSLLKDYTQYKTSDLIGEQLTIEGYQAASTDNQLIYKTKTQNS